MNSPRSNPLRAVVTGSSSGIGRAIAVQLARDGSTGEHQVAGESIDDRQSLAAAPEDRLVVHYCANRDGALETARRVESYGVKTTVVQADLREAADRIRLLDQTFEFCGLPTTWVNNAGADVLTGQQSKLAFEQKLRLLMETDVIATISLTRAFVQRHQSQGTGARSNVPARIPSSITFIGWDQSALGMEGDAGQMFGPVKSAVTAFAASLAQDVAPAIRVNTVAPGWIKTAWGESTDEYWDRRAKGQSLMRCWGTPEDVAQAVSYVAAPENRFLTGQVIAINGGWDRRFPDPRSAAGK